MLKSRYAKGQGTAPVHLAAIDAGADGAGSLLFSEPLAVHRRVPFATQAELLRLLARLLRERVPLAVGGMCPGPADAVALLIAGNQLAGPFIELSWSGPQQWTVREIPDTATTEWAAVADAATIAAMAFDPGSLQRSA
ncbi:hypothetical protein [Pseudomonas sp. efr-133-TYG-5]|jgi:hypothetical protein|uniref:hypothetical protein n=1 Tax=Pseudomonas sp. efr-133-TYG-5 TaxID=3040310 RepID=UPI0025541561|nr:hypothetical protein [Pseudomonas sp. efr-133-TYG-5]